jgi:hypothetical protein
MDRETKKMLRRASSTPLARRMIRVAYSTKDPVLRRGILESIRVAGYPQEFMNAVSKQTFKNPSTGNMVKFVSLPPAEQSKIYSQWQQKAQQQGGAGGAGGAQAPLSSSESKHVMKAVEKVLGRQVKNVAEMMDAAQKKVPWRLSMVAPSSSGGKRWEVYGNADGTMEVSFGPVGGWSQTKPVKGNIGTVIKKIPQKKDKGYSLASDSQVASWDRPVKADPKSIAKDLSKKFKGDPAKVAQGLEAAMIQLGMAAKKRPNMKLDAVVEGLAKEHAKYKEQAQAQAQPPAPPAPPKAPEAPSAAPAPAPKPTGKHKDRKELRAKPKKKMSDAVKVSEDLSSMLIPSSLPEAAKAQAKKQLESANYELLAKLRENAKKALDDPEGAYAQALAKGGYTPDGIKKMHTELSKALTPALGKKYHPDVLSVANKHDLESEDADEVAKFKGNKPARGKKLTPQELFNRFLQKAAPETKKRMQGMPLDDFMVMYKSIMADEEEDVEAPGKTASRLPQEPHTVMQDALEEGIVALDEDDDGVVAFSIFDDPSSVEKTARKLSEEDRAIVRIAMSTEDRVLRRRLVSLVAGS